MGKEPSTPEQRERHRAAVKCWADKHKEERRAYNNQRIDENREHVPLSVQRKTTSFGLSIA